MLYLAAIDFTKAFDLVNHNNIIKKLINLGVRRSIIPIVCSFLSNRSQNTKLVNHTSSVKTVTHLCSDNPMFRQLSLFSDIPII